MSAGATSGRSERPRRAGPGTTLAPPWPDRVPVAWDDFLPTVGRVVRRFGDRLDSRTRVIGIETHSGRFVVKHAADPEAIEWLRSAIRFHAAVSHPCIPPILHHLMTTDGLAIVLPWAPGEALADKFDPHITPRDDPRSPYRRFLQLPVPEITKALDQLIRAHLAVAEAGFVAVDLYDGCLIYDFGAASVSLIDLDMYRPGPYVLEAERQFGSDAFMAPEEWRRGSVIDERTTVFTLGRFMLVLLGCDRYGPAERAHFRGSDRRFEIAMRACADDPDERYATVEELWRDWRDPLQSPVTGAGAR